MMIGNLPSSCTSSHLRKNAYLLQIQILTSEISKVLTRIPVLISLLNVSFGQHLYSRCLRVCFILI